jgi:hypothetical protein
MLAKIGHALAVADRPSLPEYTPLLCDLILGRDAIPTHFVGCISPCLPEPEPNTTHRMHLQRIEALTGHYLLANIRMFASLGAPEYSVVVGKLS